MAIGTVTNKSSSSLLSTSSCMTSLLSKIASGPSPLMSSPQSSLPGSVILCFFLGLRPASLSFVKRCFCRSRDSVGNDVVVPDGNVVVDVADGNVVVDVADGNVVFVEKFVEGAAIERGGDMSSWMACTALCWCSHNLRALQISLVSFLLIFRLHVACVALLPYQSRVWSWMGILH